MIARGVQQQRQRVTRTQRRQTHAGHFAAVVAVDVVAVVGIVAVKDAAKVVEPFVVVVADIYSADVDAERQWREIETMATMVECYY